MIQKNEYNLTDENVAQELAELCYANSNRETFPMQLFIEALVLPKNVGSYTEEEMKKYIFMFMKRFSQTHKPKSK